MALLKGLSDLEDDGFFVGCAGVGFVDSALCTVDFAAGAVVGWCAKSTGCERKDQWS